MMDQNNRKTPRITHTCYITIWEKSGYNTLIVNAINISSGGILVSTDQGLMVGSKIDLKIEFSKKDVFECAGRVLRCKKYNKDMDNDREFFTVAIAFDNLNEQQVNHLKLKIEDILKKVNKLS